MNILLIGSGGREHTILKKIKENPFVTTVYALPGNGGMSDEAVCINIAANDVAGITEFAKNNEIDFAIVAPDDPLVLGTVDALNDIGIACFGPKANAAIIEGSKVFSKELMKKYSIPTAAYEVFDDPQKAEEYVKTLTPPIVIKADGLALGKGVIIAETMPEAFDAIKTIMQDKVFGKSGNQIVVEEFLTGPEVSVLAFTDGKSIVPMVSSMDHKRALDNDEGLNTGGMGTIAPNPFYTKEAAQRCMSEIFIPTMNAMNAEGRTFTGCLYFGLMITDNGPKVIEYNCRFGDPETQVVLPLLKTDLLDIMIATSNQTLDTINVEFSTDSACCLVLASEGYPAKYQTGYEITVDDDCTSEIYYAGVKTDNNRLITSGGRVLGVVSTAPDLKQAVELSYKNAEKVHFENKYCRTDIGGKALKYAEDK